METRIEKKFISFIYVNGRRKRKKKNYITFTRHFLQYLSQDFHREILYVYPWLMLSFARASNHRKQIIKIFNTWTTTAINNFYCPLQLVLHWFLKIFSSNKYTGHYFQYAKYSEFVVLTIIQGHFWACNHCFELLN